MPAPPSALRRPVVLKAAALLFSLGLALGLGEAALRVTAKKPAGGGGRGVAPVVPCDGCSYVYAMNPKFPGISAQQIRDREFPPEAPAGVFRVMVLGDSIAHGLGVPAEASFPKVLEKRLNEPRAAVEIINAATPAYTAYNELHAYRERLRQLHPKLVLISTCMNDAVDPALHWAAFLPRRVLDALPAAAIPNAGYHRDTAVAALDRQARERALDEHSRLRRLQLYKLLFRRPKGPPEVTAVVDGRRVPVHVTGEENTTLQALTDWDSPEWVWLRGVYDALLAAVREGGAVPALIVNPLAYQLEPGYPLAPQKLFARYCAERKVACLDLTPALAAHGGAALFLGRVPDPTVLDIWHYNPEGHRVAATEIEAFLRREKLLPAAPEAP